MKPGRSIIIDVRKRCHAGLDPASIIGETPDQVRGDSQADGDHMGALYFGDNLDVLREEIIKRPEYYDITSGVHDFKKTKKEQKYLNLMELMYPYFK